jgi:FHS family glucose/mannose:H+ symporter-like MFS transporter
MALVAIVKFAVVAPSMQPLINSNSEEVLPSHRLVFLVHLGFVLTGISTTLLGPLLPTLGARWGLSDARSGDFFLAQFFGSLIGVIVCGRLLRLQGFRFCFVAGFALMAVGLAALGRGPWIAALVSIFVYGCGIGFSIGATNLWVGESNPSHRASALSLVNFSWTIGALASPSIVALGDRAHHLWHIVLALAVAACLLTFAFSVSKVETRLTTETEPSGSAATVQMSRMFQNQTAIIFCLLFFLYVGTENSLSGWVATYAHRLQASSNDAWAFTPSFFWAGLLSGRLFLPVVLRRVSDLKLLRASLALAIAGCVLLLYADRFQAVVVACAICGAGLGGVFPLAMSFLSAYCGTKSRELAGIVLAIGGLGGGVMPWSVGLVSTSLGSLRTGLLIPLVGTILLSLISAFKSSALRVDYGPADDLRTAPGA